MKKDKKEKIVLLVFLAAVIFVVLISGWGGKKADKNELIFIIDYGNSGKQALQIPLQEKKRVWNLLQQAALLTGAELEADSDFTPTKIKGFLNGSGGKHWVFYLNGVKQNASPYNVYAGPNDKVVFRFQ